LACGGKGAVVLADQAGTLAIAALPAEGKLAEATQVAQLEFVTQAGVVDG
jgi:hypothetical protein